MTFAKLVFPVALLGLAACQPVSNTNVSVSGDGVVGISTGTSASYATGAIGGPPPGRTSSERTARKEYYRGPRGDEF